LKIQRLYPPPAREVSAVYEDLALPPTRRGDVARPYVALNMVSSVDGKTATGGKTAGLGSRIDRQTMRTLRSRADAVMIGAGTLRAEKLSLGLDQADTEPPLGIIVTGTGDVPLAEHLIVTEEQEVLVLVSEAAPNRVVERLRRFSQVMTAPADSNGAIDLRSAMRILRAEWGIESLVLEGGPGLNHALISRHLVDELFHTIAPELLGGTSAETLTLLRGPALPALDRPVLELVSIHLADGELFLRYSLIGTGPRSGSP
jgi:2,5-diamino-6-(ribosylamino)-4(3H)-pyrimidinone 5'-phosphate reductase